MTEVTISSDVEKLESEGRSLVVRSTVPPAKDYKDYRKYLRYDFFYSCAYCTMTESEAAGIRFTIDHYEPRTARPDLVNSYENLMYACDICNSRKGDRAPSQRERNDGFRFYRPDQDVYNIHFKITGINLEYQTNIGKFTLLRLDLNRPALRKLRELRERLTKCAPLVFEGVFGLRSLKIDEIPPEIRGRAQAAIRDVCALEERVASEIDGLLRANARSFLLDGDDSPEEQNRQKERLKQSNMLHSLYAEEWRKPRKKTSGKR
jgi:hypothetical protein